VEPHATGLWLAAAGGLLLLAGVLSPVSRRLGVPGLLIFLVLGMAAGSDGIGGIPFDDYALAFRLGTIALVLILFDGGLNTPIAALRIAGRRALLLATLGVVLTAGGVAVTAHLLGFSWPVALLIGSVVSSTDAAAVFSVLRGSGMRLEARTAATLEVESGLNDPLAVLLTIAATQGALGLHTTLREVVLGCVVSLAVGAGAGLASGWGGLALLRRVRLPATGMYPVLTVAIAFAAFGVATLLSGSGFLAVYVAAIVVGAGALPYRASVRVVHDGLAWLAQLSMFLMLGLLVYPSRMGSLADEGLILAAVLAFAARPLAVLLLLAPFAASLAERGFVAWVGLRGAVPVVLATYPVLAGVPEGNTIFHLVFFITLASCLLPGATVAWLARRLGLGRVGEPLPPASIELISRRDYPGDFVWYAVSHASAVAGAAVRDLPLPETSLLVLVLRRDTLVPARGDTVLREDDQVCIFVPAGERPLLDLLFGASLGDSG
jgi:cell volume regulation protein A